MNILIVGFGSIGQRHLNNLLEKRPENNYFVLKSSTRDIVIQDCKVIKGKTIYDHYSGVHFFQRMSDIDLYSIDAAFICNDSSKHLDVAFQLLERDIDLFIEKPIDSDTAKVVEFANELIKGNSIAVVGYQTRFHPVYLKTKEIFEKQKHNVNYMEIKWANYLPSFHNYEDYTKRYAGKKSLGGGVLLTLSHEVNILNSFFNDCEIESSLLSFSKNFSIDVEDAVFALFRCNDVNVNFTLGYSQTFEERYIKFQTYDKYVVGDLISNTVKIFSVDGKEEKYEFSLKRNELFEKEVEYFFNCIETREAELNTVWESLRDMELIDELRSRREF